MRNFKRVLITGISGSGGSYLAEQILERNPNISIHGITRWHSTTTVNNLRKIANKVQIYECDLCDLSSVIRTLEISNPDLIFNLASHANVRACFDTPITVVQNNILSTLNLLEAIRLVKLNPLLVHCSTSEVYGQVDKSQIPINENCPINPVNPYSVSKCTQDQLVYSYGKAYDISAIRTRMFAYINPRRADLFATSWARQIVAIERGEQNILKHGNLESLRTLIDARDAMDCYWNVALFGEIGEAYNLGGKNSLMVGEFLEKLVKYSSVDINCEPDPKLFRPVDITLQVPDTSKYESLCNWEPIYTLEESVEFLLKEVRQIMRPM